MKKGLGVQGLKGLGAEWIDEAAGLCAGRLAKRHSNNPI